MSTEGTESGLEEFVLWVKDGFVMTVIRQDHQTIHEHCDWDKPLSGVTLVKAYAPEKWQGFPYVPGNIEDVQIGYTERRLTAQEVWNVTDYIFRYWDIPF